MFSPPPFLKRFTSNCIYAKEISIIFITIRWDFLLLGNGSVMCVCVREREFNLMTSRWIQWQRLCCVLWILHKVTIVKSIPIHFHLPSNAIRKTVANMFILLMLSILLLIFLFSLSPPYLFSLSLDIKSLCKLPDKFSHVWEPS